MNKQILDQAAKIVYSDAGIGAPALRVPVGAVLALLAAPVALAFQGGGTAAFDNVLAKQLAN